ncbi:S-adenosyl-L-methionine-dependent methyltransferase [Phanerochaete sordida]|uniref:S-adenosyl-L-methionine-dependent methyltransferase n=1 Tax=Phanerochaete sordida TaxID=48140 RepID=A0A9P3G0C3_9APHY|nr:S-adenosyl-L-methionine-dependent methyltransferase [Phanerochaete sordida]
MPVATTTYFQNSPERPSYSTAPPSPDRKRSTKREDKWIIQHGAKLHSYARDKAPYPFAYNRDVLDMSCTDHAFIARLKGSVSFVDFKRDPPHRCLDLGTGLGDWVVDAAHEWPECSFVGYDLVNVQIPLFALEDALAARIQWVHGNFLRQKLPFEDDEFDHVHIHGIGFAVPENKWTSLFQEVYRVLRPGGTVEVIEEDAIFPTLPRWFTAPLNAPLPRVQIGPDDNVEESAMARLPVPSSLPHDHALLEHLFYAVFHNRFLNPTPSSMLPSYFTTFFGHVLSPPVINFPMPPIAPLQLTRPGALAPAEPRRLSDASESTEYSTRSSQSTQLSELTGFGSGRTRQQRSKSVSTAASSVSMGTLGLSTAERCTCAAQHGAAYEQEEGTRIGGAAAVALFPVCAASGMDEHTLFFQLRRAVGQVLAAQEAMWEELREMLEQDAHALLGYGWEPTEFDLESGRLKFDAMLEQYKNDMQIRISLWHAVEKTGWKAPRRDPLSKPELLEQKRLREAIAFAQEAGKLHDMGGPCRSLRLLTGVKVV